MGILDRTPQLFRIPFLFIGTALAALALVLVYLFGRAPSDENIFETPASSLYVTRPLADDRARDTLMVGDLVVACRGSDVVSVRDIDSLLALAGDQPPRTITAVRLHTKHSITLAPHDLRTPFVRDIGHTVIVVNVTPGGASDRAGMKVGDHITAINGKTFVGAGEADFILRQAQIGKTIDYAVIRGNAPETLDVTIAAFGLNIGLLVFLVSGFIIMGTGLVLGGTRPQYAAARTLGMFFLLVGFAMVVNPVQRGINTELLAVARQYGALIAGCFAFPLYMHSNHFFPRERPDLLSRRWLRYTAYGLGLAAFAAALFEATIPFFIAFGMTVLFSLLAPVLYRKGATPESRKMLRPVRSASIIVIIAILLLVFVIQRWGAFSGLQLLGYLGFLVLLIPASHVYVIAHYQLLEFRFRIRKTMQYAFLSLIWGTIAVVVLLWGLAMLVQADLNPPNIRLSGTTLEILDGPPPLERKAALEKTLVIAGAILLTFGIWQTHRAGERFIARKFFRTRYDYRRAGSELAEVMATTLDMKSLARGIVVKLGGLMHLKRAGIVFYRNEATCCCEEGFGVEPAAWERLVTSADAHLLTGIQTHLGADHLPPPLKEMLRAQEFQLVVPIRSKNKLAGVILIGEKRSEAPLEAEDVEFLSSVSKQASVAVDNAFLYEDLAEQERLRHELEIARRIQMESLPQKTPSIPGLDIAGTSIPAMEVGGDYFDYLNGSPDTLTVIVGDVSGKGTSAALYMSKVQGILRSLHGFGLSPRELFIRANALLCGDIEKKSFVTAIGAAINVRAHTLSVARAGHLPLFHYTAARDQVMRVLSRGLGLGLSPRQLFAEELEERPVTFHLNDIFVLVSDGITEGKNPDGDEFGEERLEQVIATSHTLPAGGICDSIIAAVGQFAGSAHQHDDQTVVVIKVV